MSWFVRRIGVEISQHNRASDDQINAGSNLSAGRHKLLVGAVKAVAGLVVVDRIHGSAEVQLLGWQASQGLLRVMGECVAHWCAQRVIGGPIPFHPALDLSNVVED